MCIMTRLLTTLSINDFKDLLTSKKFKDEFVIQGVANKKVRGVVIRVSDYRLIVLVTILPPVINKFFLCDEFFYVVCEFFESQFR